MNTKKAITVVTDMLIWILILWVAYKVWPNE
jgi:hypothetical protein